MLVKFDIRPKIKKSSFERLACAANGAAADEAEIPLHFSALRIVDVLSAYLVEVGCSAARNFFDFVVGKLILDPADCPLKGHSYA